MKELKNTQGILLNKNKVGNALSTYFLEFFLTNSFTLRHINRKGGGLRIRESITFQTTVQLPVHRDALGELIFLDFFSLYSPGSDPAHFQT